MEAIIFAVPAFAGRVNTQRFMKRIEVLSGDGAGSIYESLSADARKGHSLAPSLWIYDELAQVGDFELLDNLETAMGKRDRTLGLIISTQAESDDHRLSRMIDDGLSGADPSIVVHLVAAPADADPFDEAVLRSVNPALGVFLNEKDVLADMRKAQRIPAFEARYRNRRLNQRCDPNTENRIVPVNVWDQCAAPVDREALQGRTCFGGLDLSGKHDLSALVLVFPSDDPEPVYDVLPILWTPRGSLPGARRASARISICGSGRSTSSPCRVRPSGRAGSRRRSRASPSSSKSGGSPTIAGASTISSRPRRCGLPGPARATRARLQGRRAGYLGADRAGADRATAPWQPSGPAGRHVGRDHRRRRRRQSQGRQGRVQPARSGPHRSGRGARHGARAGCPNAAAAKVCLRHPGLVDPAGKSVTFRSLAQNRGILACRPVVMTRLFPAPGTRRPDGGPTMAKLHELQERRATRRF